MKKFTITVFLLISFLGVNMVSYSENSVSDTSIPFQTIQCRGITLQGIQCKRFVSNGDGYCYQHINQKSETNKKDSIQPQKTTINSGTTSVSSNTGYSQCNGVTKSGNQCKRMVKGSKYCYQHGG
jgi:uncharacterized membrane protein